MQKGNDRTGCGMVQWLDGCEGRMRGLIPQSTRIKNRKWSLLDDIASAGQCLGRRRRAMRCAQTPVVMLPADQSLRLPPQITLISSMF